MNSLNIIFLEEYKHLDKLIKEMFGTEKGVSDYIDTATNTFNLRFNSDIKTLRHLRHIRNRLTHDTDTFNIQMCTQTDIDWLKDFYQKVLTVSDPISLCIKQNNTHSDTERNPPSNNKQAYHQNTNFDDSRFSSNTSSVIWIFVLLGITVALALLYFFR